MAAFGKFESVEDVRAATRSRLIDQERARQDALNKQLIGAGGTPAEKVGLGVGSAFGTGLARGLGLGEDFGDEVDADPEVRAAMKRGVIAKQLQELPDPGTAAWYEQAAPLLAEAGMHEQALELAIRGRGVRKGELAESRAVAKAAKVEELAEWNAQTSMQKAQHAAIDPNSVPGWEDKTPKERKQLQAENKEWVETQKLKVKAALSKITAPRQTKVTTKDVEQFAAIADEAGIGPGAFKKWFGFANDDKALGQFTTRLKHHTQAVRDAAASKTGETITDDQILRALKNTAVSTGAFEVDEEGNVTNVDAAKLQPLMDAQLGQFGTPPAATAPAAPVAPAKRKPIDLSSGAF